jgi:hypothetical protein
LTKRVRHPGDEESAPQLLCCTTKQLRNKLSYETTRLRPQDADTRFRRAYADRHATARTHPTDGSTGDGMGTLTLHHSVDTVQVADYRLTLAAKAVRAQGDPRTLEQLRTDLAMDLLIGKATIQSPATELDDIGNGARSAPEGWMTRLSTPDYARPIVNVTVPIQTLLGLSDDPGVLSGGTVLPAALGRMIAQQPDSTWHRMLTDPAGTCVEVSTKSYRPTNTIWNDVVARYQTCYRAACDRPAADSELDHKIPHPEGETSNTNLQPGCGRDHKAKHAPGYGVTTDEAGQTSFHTRAGFTHPVTQASQPTGESLIDDGDLDIQYSATEFLATLRHLANHRKPLPPPPGGSTSSGPASPNHLGSGFSLSTGRGQGVRGDRATELQPDLIAARKHHRDPVTRRPLLGKQHVVVTGLEHESQSGVPEPVRRVRRGAANLRDPARGQVEVSRAVHNGLRVRGELADELGGS